MGVILFMDAEFNRLKLSVVRAGHCIGHFDFEGFVVDHFSRALYACFSQVGIDCSELCQVYFLNGPGSTMGIRTLCAFVNTLIALKKIDKENVFTCNSLYFYQAYETYIVNRSLPFQILARIGFNQCLSLQVDNKNKCLPIKQMRFEDARAQTDCPLFYLSHPSLKEQNLLNYDLEKIVPLLKITVPPLWHP